MLDAPDSETVLKRNNVSIIGSGETALMLAHGFGCDQNMWRFMLPLLEPHFKIVLFDYVGSGQSDLNAFNTQRYQNLEGYAKDVNEICQALNLSDVVFVGHSVSGIIGALASIARPQCFSKLVMVCPSPCFLNLPPDYFGGFDKEDLEELINLLDKNYIGWANYLAPLVMGQGNDPALISELEGSFCSTDPKFAKPFAKATFFSDYRFVLEKVAHPTLILQSSDDSLASVRVGEYTQSRLPNAHLNIIEGHGHCLHMTSPEIVCDAIRHFIQ